MDKKIRLTMTEDEAITIRYMLDFCRDKVSMVSDEKQLLNKVINEIEKKTGHVSK